MPIPFLFIAAGLAAGAVKKGVQIYNDQTEANDVNAQARSIVREWKDKAETARTNSSAALSGLGGKKARVLDRSIMPFIDVYDRIKNIELTDSAGMNEIQKFRIDKQGVIHLREMGDIASSALASSAAAGALTAFGAYGGAMAFGAASTGTAISALSGAAATNATLAFFGGGSLAAGGLGVAGGAAVLGGLVALPTLAVMGFVAGAKASENKDNAYSNLSEARSFREEMKTLISLCSGIRRRSNMFFRMLVRLECALDPMTQAVRDIVNSSGTDYRKFSAEDKQVLAVALSTVGAIKSVLDTPLLTEDGKLTEESAALPDRIMPMLNKGR